MAPEGTADAGETTGDGAATDDEADGPLPGVYRTVSTRYGPHGDAEMDAIGWGLFLGVLFLLLPLLPVFVAVWLVSKAVEAVAGRHERSG